MSLYQLTDRMLADTVGTSLGAFRPELTLCTAIVLLLLVRMIAPGWRNGAFFVMLAGSLAALYFVAPWRYLAPGAEEPSGAIFTGMLVFDRFSVYMRALLLLFAVLFGLFTWASGNPHRGTATEFYVLILGALLGMCLMVSANHMLIVLLGVEMASVPAYVLAGMVKHRRQSSEAALKYAVFGAGTAGVMLYGISLLVGMLGSAHLPTMASQLADILRQGASPEQAMVLVLGGLMVMVGLAFKLSAVPFHFWAPDVFEGATAEVGGFLSVASKAAALGLLVRLALGFGAVVGPAADFTPYAQQYICGLVALLAAVTCTFGNLAAYGQTNMKRLLAYSTIAHAGYMMMPVAAAVALIGTDDAGAQAAVASLAFYAGVYLFMNLGAFAMVAFLRNAIGSEQIEDYAGLIRRSPGLAVCFAIILFSMVGLPPLAGFVAKFTIFAALLSAGQFGLLAIGVLNTVLALFYYLRVVKVIVRAPEPDDGAAIEIPLSSIPGGYCLLITVPLVVLGIWWNGLFAWALAAASSFLH